MPDLLADAVAARAAAAERGDTVAFVEALARERLLRESSRRRQNAFPVTFNVESDIVMFDPKLHPRGRYGRFVDVLEKLTTAHPSSIVRLPSGYYASFKYGKFRVHNASGKMVQKTRDPEHAARALVAGHRVKPERGRGRPTERLSLRFGS